MDPPCAQHEAEAAVYFADDLLLHRFMCARTYDQDKALTMLRSVLPSASHVEPSASSSPPPPQDPKPFASYLSPSLSCLAVSAALLPAARLKAINKGCWGTRITVT